MLETVSREREIWLSSETHQLIVGRLISRNLLTAERSTRGVLVRLARKGERFLATADAARACAAHADTAARMMNREGARI